MKKRNIAEVGESENASDAENASACEARDPTFSPKPVTGGKKYVKVKTSKVSAESCILADRCPTSIRQHSDQLLSVAGSAIAASTSTIFREREKIRMTALKNSKALLNGCDFLQLCYDGPVVNKSDIYVFLGQFLQADCKKESVIAVKSFPSGTSVTSEVLFNTITTEACEKLLAKVYSVMADTTAINTGKKSGVNKRLQDYIMENVGHDIHTLECLFYVNEIYFTSVVSLV